MLLKQYSRRASSSSSSVTILLALLMGPGVLGFLSEVSVRTFLELLTRRSVTLDSESSLTSSELYEPVWTRESILDSSALSDSTILSRTLTWLLSLASSSNCVDNSTTVISPLSDPPPVDPPLFLKNLCS